MTASSNDKGDLPIVKSGWQVPYEVAERDGVLEFTPLLTDTDVPTREIDAAEFVRVIEFAQLARFEGSPHDHPPDDESLERERIVAFARRYGPLVLGPDGYPTSRIPAHLLSVVRSRAAFDRLYGEYEGPQARSERLVDWIRFSLQARAVMAACELLSETRFKPLTDQAFEQLMLALWRYLAPLNPSSIWFDDKEQSHVRRPRTRPEAKRTVAEAIQTWLDWGDVRARFIWPDQAQPRVEWAADTLFGALASQLSLIPNRPESFAFCSACARPYATTKKSPTGRDPYCDDKACKRLCQSREQAARRARHRAKKQASV